MNKVFTLIAAAIVLLSTTLPSNAVAYIGPGVGLTAIGTVVALIGTIVLAIVGFIWYPLKRLSTKIKKWKQKDI